MSIEAMKQALGAFEDILSAESRNFGMEYIKGYCVTMIRDLRPDIEQAEKQDADEWDEKALWGERQEPVGEIVQAFEGLTAVSIPVMPPVGTKLYAAPPQREWVGLTEDEITELFCDYDSSQPD